MSLAALPVQPRTPETISARVAALQVEARDLARLHIAELAQALIDVARLSHEIHAGGDAYHVGVRELAGRLTDDAAANFKTITALLGREKAR